MKEEKKYIFVNLVSATPMTKGEFKSLSKTNNSGIISSIPSAMKDLFVSDKFADKEGYAVNISGSLHWFPKKDFEDMTLELSDNKSLPSSINISEDMVNGFIESHDTMTLGTKTTVVRATLKNGFEIVETSGCVDDENYDMGVGERSCLEKIKSRVWDYLGFLLQTAWKGNK